MMQCGARQHKDGLRLSELVCPSMVYQQGQTQQMIDSCAT